MRITHDLTKLNKFVKSGDSDWRVRVGIFGNRSERRGNDEMDNAAIGAAHELGSFERHLPIRSWLLMPIRVSTTQIIRDASYSMVQLFALGRTYDVLKRLGFACEDAILKAFSSGGFDTWEPISQRTAKAKGSDAILIDTGQLRRSVASQVVKV